MQRLRLRRQSVAPHALPNEEQIYADATGALKKRSPDGTISDVGGESPGGGSQPLRVVTLDVAFDTPGLVIPASGPAGIKVCDVADYEAFMLVQSDVIMGALVSEAWDGNSPRLNFVTGADRGNLPGTPPVPFNYVGNLSSADNDGSTGATGVFTSSMSLNLETFYFHPAGELYVYVDDESGADPVSTQGAARLVAVLMDWS